jgi:hypothetical protein
MGTDIKIVDFVVHLHPESSCDNSERMERDLRAHEGVVSVHFNAEEHPHAMVVAYNPEATSSAELLAEIRLPGIECGSMKALANWVKNSDQVIVF